MTLSLNSRLKLEAVSAAVNGTSDPEYISLAEILAVIQLASTPELSYISTDGIVGVDDTTDVLKTITLPANSLRKVGDHLNIKTLWRPDTGDAIGVLTSLGGILICESVSGVGADLKSDEIDIYYVDTTHANVVTHSDGALSAALTEINVAGFDWTTAQDISIAQLQIVDNHIVVYSIIVDISS